MRKALKISCALLLLLFAGAQFVRPARVNPPVVAGRSIEDHALLTPAAAEVLRRSCMDCHSNRTEWPWYSNIAPASWFVTDHVNHGRRHLNFSEWGSYDRQETEGFLKGICRFSKAGLMPLNSYTLVHRGAKLSPADVKTLCDWSNAEQQRLASNTRADAR
jgi:hypothetical protein